MTLANERPRAYYAHMAKRKPDKWGAEVTKALQRAIRESDLSQNEIARRAGIDPGMVCRFVNGQRGMTLATAARVADVLGLDLRLARKRTTKKGG